MATICAVKWDVSGSWKIRTAETVHGLQVLLFDVLKEDKGPKHCAIAEMPPDPFALSDAIHI